MKRQIIVILSLTLLLTTAIIPVEGSIKDNNSAIVNNFEYTNIKNNIIDQFFGFCSEMNLNYVINPLNDGAIWTTLEDCGDYQQNVNHFYAGDDVYVNGENFEPNNGYNWYIKGAPGSCDPNTIVANGIVYTDAYGDFCFNAYTVQSDDCGVYQVNVGDKKDNFQVITCDNDPPLISNPNPQNGASNVPVSISELSVTIEDQEGDSFDWTIETSPYIGSNSGTGESNGTKTCSISNLEYNTTYTWFVNATDLYGSGNISELFFSFTTISGASPVISNPDPSNGATEVSINLDELSVTIEDPNGDSFDWTIETSPNIGSNSGYGEYNGIKTCSVSGLEYDTTYIWIVTATDTEGSGETTEKTYTFTTKSNNPPVISNPDPFNGATGVPLNITEISVTIQDPEGDNFDWTIDTVPDIGNSFYNGATNGTKKCSVSGLEYNTIYNWYVTAIDTQGSNTTTTKIYTFTTINSNPPIIFDPNPDDGLNGVPITLTQLSVTIQDPENDSFDWTIETNPDIGNSYGYNQYNGIKTCTISGLEYETTYTWYVNATDNGNSETTEEIYTFTTETEENDPPLIYNPEPPTGSTWVLITTTQLQVNIQDPENDKFDWNIQTIPDIGINSGTTEYSGIKTCTISGLEYETSYTWIVEATDTQGSGQTKRRYYTFKTEPIPPNPPNPPQGPTSLEQGQVGTFCTQTTHPQGLQVQYRYDWDAQGTHDISYWTNLVPSGTKICLEHSWDKSGIYVIKTQAKDEKGAIGKWSNGMTIIIGNHPPEKPERPWKKTRASITATFCTKTEDPDGDQVYYLWDWGDGTQSNWIGPHDSGETVCITHTWTEEANYKVKVKAKDIYNFESEWSSTTDVHNTQTKIKNEQLIKYLARYIHILPILKIILQRCGTL